jgi:hypothetical protein
LKETVASSIAYVMMKSNWPTQNIREKLAYFQQSGGSTLGENDPYFVAVSILAKARESKAKTERMTLAKEMGIVILALVEAEKGTKAIHKKRFMEATKKAVPDPRYPNPAAQEAAA